MVEFSSRFTGNTKISGSYKISNYLRICSSCSFLIPDFFVLLTPIIVQKILLVCAKYHTTLFSTYSCVNHYINAQGKIAANSQVLWSEQGQFFNCCSSNVLE